jgi:predicted 2-oxoglutarate/Fe(II)-dependent dioxygenase YbiX
MTTTTFELIWDYQDDDRENNIKGGSDFIDATYGNKKVKLSAKLEELINEELNPDNF